MKIGIVHDAYSGPTGPERMKRHGYDCADWQGFLSTENELFFCKEEEFRTRLQSERRRYERAGIEISQVHGPWRYPPVERTPEERKKRMEDMCRSIRGAAELGAKYWIVHPIMPFGTDRHSHGEEEWRLNVDFLGGLAREGEREGVTVCLENMPFKELATSSPRQILRLVKEVGSESLRVCLDTGHCAVLGEDPADAVRLFGTEYLRTIHVHDNDGRGDRHFLPWFGVIHWDRFTAALKEIGWKGVMSMECRAPEKLPEGCREEAQRALAAIARTLADMAE